MLEKELQNDELRALTKRRLERYRKAVVAHKRSLQKLLQPIEIQTLEGNYESYLALRSRLPTDQGLNTYYPNIHRDWAWGEEENRASLKQIRSVLHDHADLGKVLVLGAGAGRLAYDVHTQLQCELTVAMDFNPLLMLVAKTVTSGESLSRGSCTPRHCRRIPTATRSGCTSNSLQPVWRWRESTWAKPMAARLPNRLSHRSIAN